MEVKLAQQNGRLSVERELTLESVIRQVILNYQNLAEILPEVVAEIRQSFQCDRLLIYGFAKNKTGSVIAESHVNQVAPLLGKKISFLSLTEENYENYKNGFVHVIEDIFAADLPSKQRDFLTSIQVRSNLVVPILLESSLWGFLISQHCQKAYQWHQREINFLKQVATQISVAIHQAELQQQVVNLQTQLELQQQKYTALYIKMQDQVKELENWEHLKNQFLKTLAQELRTPITSISLAAQTLEGLFTPAGILDIELVPQLLQILHDECGRENQLINDLRTLAYVQSASALPTLILIDLPTWLNPIVESFRDIVSFQKQKLNLHIPENLRPIDTDITDLERIVHELLNYACQCTPMGETIKVSVSQNTDTFDLIVSISGIEISTPELAEIFQPFYRPAKVAPWKSSNTGLEMALVKAMVKRLGGSINACNDHNHLTITTRFPQSDFTVSSNLSKI